MTNELINTVISAVTGAVAGGLVTLLLDKRKELRDDKKEREIEEKRIYEERPELEIIEYKEFVDSSSSDELEHCDINVFLTEMKDVCVEGDSVTAQYREELFNKEEWCSVIYHFRNTGRTDIRCVSPICVCKKNMMMCDTAKTQIILEHGILNYSTMYDRKIRVGDTFSMKVSCHKEYIPGGENFAIMIMDIEDCNSVFWEQPLFFPTDKIYESYKITHKKFRDSFLADSAIECFKKPWLC